MSETRISVQIKPNAQRNEITGFAEEVWRIKIAAPPIEGKANDALVTFLAEKLQLRKSQIHILSGLTSRNKLIAIEGLDPTEVARCLS